MNDIHLDFRENHLPDLSGYFKSSILNQLEDVQTILDGLTAFSSHGNEKDLIKNIIASYQSESSISALANIEELRSKIENLPGSVSLPVSEKHRTWQKGDSLTLKVSKLSKNVRFKLGNKEQIRTFEYKYLVGIAYCEFHYLALMWQKTLFGMIANLLVELKVLALNIYSGKADKDDFLELINGQQKLLIEFRSKAETQIQQQMEVYKERIESSLEIAGTIELPKRASSKEMYLRKMNAFSMDAKESARIWGDLLSVNLKQLEAAATLNTINGQLNALEHDLQNKFKQRISKAIEPDFLRLRKELTGKLELLESAPSISKAKLEEICEQAIELTTSIVNDQLVTPLSNTIDDKILSKYLDDFAANVSQLANKVESELTLVEDLRYNEQLPEFLLKPIQWQSLYRRILGDEYLSELLAEDMQPEQKLALIVEDFSEAEQIISTNLAFAQDVEKNEDEEPYELVKKGIELALIKIDEIGSEYPQIEEFLESELLKHQQELAERISKLLIDQDSGQIKREDAKIKAKESASNFRDKLGIYWAKFVDRLELARRFTFSKIKSMNESIRSFLGMVESEHINVQKTNIAALLHDIDLKYRQLPYIYRRLFDFKRPAESTFFVKYQPHFETVSKAYELWQSDFPSSIAILGEKGSGRTTELNYIKAEIFSDVRVEQVNFEKTIFKESELLEEFCKQLKIVQRKSSEEIVSLLSRRRKKTVIVVENVQNCFLRTVNGYEAINTLLYLISETKDKVLWVCSCSKYGWNFLNIAVKISDYFSHSIMVDNLPAENVTEIIMKRQIASGYQLEIKPDESTKNSRAHKKLLDDNEKRDEYLLKVLFDRLNKMAQGNSTVAMIYWIRCIQNIDSSQIQIELLESTGIEYLSELDSETLFVLAAFVMHDVLNAVELAECLNYSTKNAETVISRLISRGLLVELAHGFSLNDLIYRQVVRLLTSRNLINA